MSGFKESSTGLIGLRGSPIELSCTDRAMRPDSVQKPAAYGAEAQTSGHECPNASCEGCVLNVFAVAIDRNGKPCGSMRLSISVRAVGEPLLCVLSHDDIASASQRASDWGAKIAQ